VQVVATPCPLPLVEVLDGMQAEEREGRVSERLEEGERSKLEKIKLCKVSL